MFIGRVLPKRTSRFLSLINTKSTKEREMFGFIVLVEIAALRTDMDNSVRSLGMVS